MENQTVIRLEVTPQELALMAAMFNQSSNAVRDMFSARGNSYTITSVEKELFKDEPRHELWRKLSKTCHDYGIDYKYGTMIVKEHLFK